MLQHGIINFLKPAGMTSHDGVYMLRRLIGEKRIGHTGTLDPMAVGVLPLCVGNATRVIDYLDYDEKEYRCELLLGVQTDTWDIWGSLLSDKRGSFEPIEEEKIRTGLASFKGDIFQLPPGYSAIRINGKRLYEYARNGQTVEVEKRPVSIKDIELISYDPDKGRVLFDVRCSKGTYVRSICQELGDILECGAAMSFLARKASGVFRIEHSVSAEELKEGWQEHLLPLDFPLAHLGAIEIPERRVFWFSNGGQLRKDEISIVRTPAAQDTRGHIRVREGLECAYCAYSEGRFLGVMIYNEQEKLFTADKVLCK